jgi:hypothetical protein
MVILLLLVAYVVLGLPSVVWPARQLARAHDKSIEAPEIVAR